MIVGQYIFESSQLRSKILIGCFSLYITQKRGYKKSNNITAEDIEFYPEFRKRSSFNNNYCEEGY